MKSVALASASALVLTALAAAPAQAYGACYVTTPGKVAIVSEYRELPVKYSAGCYDAEWASWDVIHPTKGWEDTLMYEGDYDLTDYMDWYDWDPTGRYTVRPADAYDSDYDEMAQNTRTMDVRLGSRLRASSSRYRSTVTVTGTATRYNPNVYPSGFRAWKGSKVTLQAKSCASCSWRNVSSAYTNASGKVTLKAVSSKKRYYRLTSSSISTTWGTSTAAFVR